jgi:uncharacterized metal-binding protein
MSENTVLRCAACAIPQAERVCRDPEGVGPAGCPTIEGGDAVAEAMREYDDRATLRFAQEASRQEAACYVPAGDELRTVKCRIEEVCEFARRMGFTRLGLAFCSGLAAEAAVLNEILQAHGFEVASVVCKAGRVPKEEIGLQDSEKIRPGNFEAMCNPISQATFLNRAGTQMNIVLGLCVGHDSLFLKHAEAYNTVLAVKDRLLGHNPLGALYTGGSYYKRLLNPE